MLIKKFRTFARGVGSVFVGLLVVYNTLSIFSHAERAFGAPGESTPLGNLGALLFDDVAVPMFINYQDTLRDREGQPLDGVYTMTFRIYDDIIDPPGDAIWTEQHQTVPVRNGEYTVLLGDSTPLSPTFFNSPDRFIGVTVNSITDQEIIPRQRFASVPYAIIADRAFSLNAADGDPQDAVFVDSDGRVGIGTTSPTEPLHVKGSLPILALQDSDSTGASQIGFVSLRDSDNLERGWFGFGEQTSTILGISNTYSDGILAFYTGRNRERMRISEAGNVGIGSPSPEAKLQVINTPQDANGNTLILGPTNASNLRLGYHDDYSWIQSHGSKPLTINPLGGNKVGIGTTDPQATLDIKGNLAINSNPLVRILRFENRPNDADEDTGVSTDEYHCVAAGWTAKYDISDLGSQVNMIWTYAKEGTWRIRAQFASDNEDEQPDVDVLCFIREISSWEEASRSLNEPN